MPSRNPMVMPEPPLVRDSPRVRLPFLLVHDPDGDPLILHIDEVREIETVAAVDGLGHYVGARVYRPGGGSVALQEDVATIARRLGLLPEDDAATAARRREMLPRELLPREMLP